LKDLRQTKIKRNLLLRAKIIHAMRHFFVNRDYLEVETPLRIPAPAPEAHIDAQPSGGWFLHTSPELCMKRLLAAGYSRIFQICKCFRQNERGDKHLPEFTILEWYAEKTDYWDMMEECEEMIRYVAKKTGYGETLHYQGQTIDLAKPWERLSVARAFEKYASIPLKKALSNNRFDEVLAEAIEPFLGRSKPVFLYDYPVEKGALARLKLNDHQYVERFELYISGIEICNAFSELTDPSEQRLRFESERDLRSSMGKDVYPMPERFLNRLSYMPEASGNALGIDRLVMLFGSLATIDDVTVFIPEEL